MHFPPAIGDEHHAVVNRRCGKHVAFKRIRPDYAVGCNVTGFRWINALEPGFVLAPPKITAAGDIETIMIKHRHAVQIARALTTIAEVLMRIAFRCSRVEGELPNLLEL